MSPRQLVRTVCRRLGFDVVRFAPSGIDPRSFPARRGRWLSELGITLLLDVGANNGGYASQARAAGYRGRIVSFEPLSSAFAELERRSRGDREWQCVQTALGASAAMADINVSGYDESSSLLAMLPRHVNALPSSAYVGKESVRVSPLDALRHQYVRPDDNVWLKLDVQGYEMRVLDGAAQTLSQVAALEMELSLAPLYEGQALIGESIERLITHGFHLIAVEEAFFDPVCGHTLQVNGIFKRPRLRHESTAQGWVAPRSGRCE